MRTIAAGFAKAFDKGAAERLAASRAKIAAAKANSEAALARCHGQPASAKPLSTKRGSAGHSPSGSVASPRSNTTTTAAATSPEMPKAKGRLAGLLAAVHRQAWLDKTDPEAGAKLRAQTTAKFQTEFLPGGKSVRCHWRKWITAVAKADGVSESDVMAYFDGEAVLSAKTKEGDIAREDLCRTAWKQFPHVII